jgi:hypothetical protein
MQGQPNTVGRVDPQYIITLPDGLSDAEHKTIQVALQEAMSEKKPIVILGMTATVEEHGEVMLVQFHEPWKPYVPEPRQYPEPPESWLRQYRGEIIMTLLFLLLLISAVLLFARG